MTYSASIKKTLLFLLMIPFFAPVNAHASSTGGVGGASVKKGVLAAEARASYSEGDESSSSDGRFQSRIHFDYGVTDSYAARIIFAQDARKNDNYEHAAITFENRFYVLRKDESGFDFGVRAAYSMKDGDKKPDNVAVEFIEVLPWQDWEIRLNQFLKHDIGEDRRAGLSFESRLQATTKISDTHRLGFESFNDFGKFRDLSGYDNQNHTIGPVLKGKIGSYSYEAGYRAGISKSAIDHGVKFFISKKF